MASKVISTYYIGNVPVYAGAQGGAHTQNGCMFNFNIRVKPEINNVGIMIIKTNDPIIHSYDNTTRAPEFELDLSNLAKLITLLKVRGSASPTQGAQEFIKLGVTTQAKYADRVKMAWVKSFQDNTTFIIETNGQQEMFVVEGVFQNEYLLEVLQSTREILISSKVADEIITTRGAASNVGNLIPSIPGGIGMPPVSTVGTILPNFAGTPVAPGMPTAPAAATTATAAPTSPAAMVAPAMPGVPNMPGLPA
jgi:hypothetical protein